MGQTSENENGPWSTATEPAPLQVGQRSGNVPGFAPVPLHTWHGASDVMFTDVVMPWTASRKSRCSSVSMSLTALGPDRALVAAAPTSRAATAEQVAEDAAEVAEVAEVLDPDVLVAAATGEPAAEPPPNPPGPPGPTPDATISRTWSYSLRFSASPSTSCAAEISLKRSSALAVAGVGVGVELLRELPVGARDLLLGRVRATRRARRSSPSRTTPAGEPSRQPSRVTRTMAGRSTRPFRR